jgi:hypothetical protein
MEISFSFFFFRGHGFVGGVDDDIQMTTTLICLDLQLVHHFIEGTGIDTTFLYCWYWYSPTVQLFVSLPCIWSWSWSSSCSRQSVDQ